MSNIFNHKTNFTAGEVSMDVLGRSDLKAYENGASTLKNVFIDPIGGVSRRAGLRFVAKIPNAGRLISFTFNTEQTYLIVLSPNKMSIYQSEELVTEITTPWLAEDIEQISWTQSADTLLLVHPDYEPRKLTRQADGSWLLEGWTYDSEGGALMQPYASFRNDISLSSNVVAGLTTLTASEDLFTDDYIGLYLRLNDGEICITEVKSPTIAIGQITKALTTGAASFDWKEQAFSPLRGWPATVTFYQGRLVIGGSRDLPNRLWLSKSFHIMNFDLGTGNDDEAIEFTILSDQVNAIRSLMSGRHLQVFTSGSEWMVSGEPLTPRNIQLKRQTRIGSPTYRYVPPVDVSGATLFASASGREIREFLFADLEQAYQATNVSLLSSHLIRNPVDMAYDQLRRLVYVVMSDGTMATLTNYRSEDVLAWSAQETQGLFKAVCVVYDDVYVLVERDGSIRLETFDDEVHTDSALLGEAETPHFTWSGIEALDGFSAKVVADDVIRDDVIINGDSITLPYEAKNVEIGLGFSHEIVPLPPVSMTSAGALPLKAVRLIEARFRVVNTQSLEVDVGNGITQTIVSRFSDDLKLDEVSQPQTTDVCIHALGWIRNGITPLWRIQSDLPRPCKILSVTTEMKVSE